MCNTRTPQFLHLDVFELPVKAIRLIRYLWSTGMNVFCFRVMREELLLGLHKREVVPRPDRHRR